MATNYIEDPKTGKTIPFEWDGDKPPTDNQINSLLIAARGSDKPSRDWDWSDVFKEPAKIAGQGVAGVLNTGVKAAKGIAGLGSLGKNLLQGKGLDASLAAATDTIGNRNAIADMGPQSKVLSALGDNVVLPAVQKTATALNIKPETLALGLEAGGDIATILGLGGGIPKTGLKAGLSPAATAKAATGNAGRSLAGMGADGLTYLWMKPKTSMDKATRARNVKTALEGGYRGSDKGARKLDADIKALETKSHAQLAEAQAQGVSASIDKAIANIEGLKREARLGRNRQADLDAIDNSIANLQAQANAEGVGTGAVKRLGIADMYEMKVLGGRHIQNQYAANQSMGAAADSFKTQIDKAAVRGFKEAIEEEMDNFGISTIAEQNKKLSDLYQLKKVLVPASNRIENTSSLGGFAMKVGTGSVMGNAVGIPMLGALIGGGVATAQNPMIAPHVASLLNKASNAGVKNVPLSPDFLNIKNAAARGGLLSGAYAPSILRDTQ